MSYQPRGTRGGTKASASTVCQKCLQKGHYSFECKGASQDRPYTSRPSRSQQLLNPRLRPQLNSETSNHETAKDGIADEQLNGKDKESWRKRLLDDLDDVEENRKVGRPPRTRSRSASFDSASTISTISTRSADSALPQERRRNGHEADITDTAGVGGRQHTNGASKKRRRTSSVSSRDDRQTHPTLRTDERNTRARKRSASPAERGRSERRASTHHGTNNGKQEREMRPRRALKGESESLATEADVRVDRAPSGRVGEGEGEIEMHERRRLSPFASRPGRRSNTNEHGLET